MLKNILIYFYVFYLKAMFFKQKILGGKAYGLGWVPSKISFEFDFIFSNVKFRFIPAAARSYGYLPANIPNEPETHLFLQRILAQFKCDVFVDVGASVGEFAIPMAWHGSVAKVIAFEPGTECLLSLSASCVGVAADKIDIIPKGVAASDGYALFTRDPRSPTASSLVAINNDASQPALLVELSTLDHVLTWDKYKSSIILIDVEGGELGVVLGGKNFIEKSLPLIIFEYNHVSRRFFSVAEMQDALGNQYRLFRLRSTDGLLDDNLNDTWNVVALPMAGYWEDLIDSPDFFACE